MIYFIDDWINLQFIENSWEFKLDNFSELQSHFSGSHYIYIIFIYFYLYIYIYIYMYIILLVYVFLYSRIVFPIAFVFLRQEEILYCLQSFFVLLFFRKIFILSTSILTVFVFLRKIFITFTSLFMKVFFDFSWYICQHFHILERIYKRN